MLLLNFHQRNDNKIDNRHEQRALYNVGRERVIERMGEREREIDREREREKGRERERKREKERERE